MSRIEDPSSLYIGLMSGTSMDGIDAVLIRLAARHCETVAAISFPYPAELRDTLIAVSRKPGNVGIDTIGDLDHWVGVCFRDAAKAMLDAAGSESIQVRAIGSHGQTIRHRPGSERPFTMQIGDPNIIATGTGITTVADFRRRDMAVGGEGAPLAPAFHQWLFGSDKQQRVVLNIGGIANVTILPGDATSVTGFDTGPGNGLMDAWIQQEKGEPFDDAGTWASDGKLLPDLLTRMLADPYFDRSPPKSTGFEYFNLDWISKHVDGESFQPVDIQTTLLALTARTIHEAIAHHAPDTRAILVCGGGVHNDALMEGLTRILPSAKWSSTVDFGLDPDWVEAAAFAWLAKQTLLGRPGNLPSVTGARQPEVLGAIYVCPD